MAAAELAIAAQMLTPGRAVADATKVADNAAAKGDGPADTETSCALAVLDADGWEAAEGGRVGKIPNVAPWRRL